MAVKRDSLLNAVFGFLVTVMICSGQTAGTITTVAGYVGGLGCAGDGGSATSAQLNMPAGLAIDQTGNLYIADTLCNCVRKVTPTGTISRVAGSGLVGFSGDGGSAPTAALNGPSGVALSSSGELLISDSGNYRIRKVSTSGIISTIAGTGTTGIAADNLPANQVRIDSPSAELIE